jgi:hypothetical protein
MSSSALLLSPELDFYRPMIFDDTGLLRAASPEEASRAFGCAFSMSLPEPTATTMAPATTTMAPLLLPATTTPKIDTHFSSPSSSSTPLRPSTPSPTASAADNAGPSSRSGGPCNHCGTTGEKGRG